MISPALKREFQVACGTVLRECPDPYAKSYASTGLTLVSSGRDDAIPVQALYIVGNMQHWRGDVAKQVRSVLRMVATAH